MEHYITFRPQSSANCKSGRLTKPRFAFQDQPKFGKQSHTLEIRTVGGSLVATAVSEHGEVIDMLRLS